MNPKTRKVYGEQLKKRRMGIASSLDSDTTLVEAKPHFYADSRILIDKTLDVYEGYQSSAPPYGLVNLKGEPFEGFETVDKKTWVSLERLMSATAKKAFEAASPPETGCPYYAALQNLGHIPLLHTVVQSPDIKRLREVVFPGAQFAPATIVNILRRIPAMATSHGSSLDFETLARNSARTLLQEPLHHAQQHARAFNFCLGNGHRGSDLVLDRDNFMPSDVIESYTRLGCNRLGQEAIIWSKPTTDFVLRESVHIADRTQGSETDAQGDHITVYPAGTKLGDIKLNEPTIGCPGTQMAYAMWNQAIDVIVGEHLWEQAA